MQQRHRCSGSSEVALVLIECVAQLADPKCYAAAYRQLPRFRQKKADSLMFERDGRLSVGAWLLLWQAFHREGVCLDSYPISYSERGKPYAEGCPLRFSISHSGEYVMCAVSRSREVGCDIQQIDAYDEGLARVCMTSRELDEIEALPSAAQRAHAFYRHWVAKESYIKALGSGLAKAPASFAVGLCGDEGARGSARIIDEASTGEADIFEVEAPEGYCAALCTLGH